LNKRNICFSCHRLRRARGPDPYPLSILYFSVYTRQQPVSRDIFLHSVYFPKWFYLLKKQLTSTKLPSICSCVSLAEKKSELTLKSETNISLGAKLGNSYQYHTCTNRQRQHHKVNFEFTTSYRECPFLGKFA
jgi:hypothetical protein